MKKLYWLILGLVILNTSWSTAQSVRWEQTLGSAGAVGGMGICPTPDGGAITAGYRNAGRDGMLADSSRGTGDALVVKYSGNGQVEWQRTLGGDRDDNGWQIRSTPDGGYFLSAESVSGKSFDHSQAARGQYDYWVIKLDASGNKQWDRSFGTDSLDALTDAWPTADGGYLLAGYSYATSAQGDKSEAGRGGGDYWLIKLDAQGNKLWDRTYGGVEDDLSMQGQPTPDGGCILMGTTASPAGGDVSQAGTGPAGDWDYWLIKLDAQGNKQWDRRYGGADGEDGQACILTPDGGYLIGGFSSSGQSGDKSQPSRGDLDYWIVKIDAQGTKQWDKTLGSSGSDYLNRGLCLLSGGGYVVVGTSRGGASGDRSQPTRGGDDCWAVGLSPTGQQLWDAAYGGDSQEVARAACATSDGGFILTTPSFSAVSGDRTVAQHGLGDQWTLKANATGGKLWDQAVGGNPDDVQQALVQAPDGTYWLGGQTEGGPGLDNDESYDNLGTLHIWLQQRDSLGTPLQTKSVAGSRQYALRSLDFTPTQTLLAAGTVRSGNAGYLLNASNRPLDADYLLTTGSTGVELGGLGNDYLGEARATPDQGAILGGTSRSGTGRTKTEPSRGGADFWVVKLNRQFAKTWDHRFGGSGLDSLVSVRRTPDGGYLLAGSTTSPADGDLTEPGRGGADYWLVKVNSTGILQWQRRYGGSGDDWLAAARPTPDGGCVLLGTTFSGLGGDLSEAPLGRRDLWALKVSSTGTVQWQHRYGGSGNDYAATLEPDPDGGFIVGASTTSPADGQVSKASRGGTDYWLLRLSAQGTVLWDQRLGGSGEDVLTCLSTTRGYGYAVGGTSNSPAGSGEHRQANKGAYDFWTLVLTARRVPTPVITAFTPGLGLPGTQVTLAGLNFTGTSSVSFNGVVAPGFVVSPDGTSISATLPAGATTGLITVVANGAGSSATAFVVPTDLVISTAQNVQGTYRNLTITGPATGGAGAGTLTGPLTVLGTLLVQDGGALLTNCQPLIGPGNFVLAAGATLAICDASGIAASAPTGAVQLTGGRVFSDDAYYVYNGLRTQQAGDGLPGTVRELTLRNADGLRLSQDVQLRQVLRLSQGNLTRAGYTLTLLSTAVGTALVDNTGGNILPGPGVSQQQRYLDPTGNPGAGYRHYASPVIDTPLSQLATSGTSPVLTTSYNSSATPGTTVPFPTVFGYDQTRLSTTNNNSGEFDKGWYVPAGFALGQALTVNLAPPALVTFSGDFTRLASIPVDLGRGPQAEAGWHLLGNPFPAPFDLAAPGATTTNNVAAAVYVFASSSRYTGVYQAFVNGIGTAPQVLAAGQGFFVRTITAGQPSQFQFNQAGRVTTFAAQPSFLRTSADTRPQVRLTLHNGLLPPDALYVYAQPGATAGLDAVYDAYKLLNSTNSSLYALAGTDVPLAIQGLAAFTPATTIPLVVTSGEAKTITLEGLVTNLPPGLPALLVDALTGTRQDLASNPTYTASIAAGTTAGRFSLAFGPAAGPLATTPAAQSLFALFPNPAQAAVTLQLPAVAQARYVLMLNVLGQVVRRQLLPAQATTTRLDLTGLPRGVYLVQCGTSTARLLVE
jgi:hypothetical protein